MALIRKQIRAAIVAAIEEIYASGKVYVSERPDLRDDERECITVLFREGDAQLQVGGSLHHTAQLDLGFHKINADQDAMDNFAENFLNLIDRELAPQLIMGVFPVGFSYEVDEEQVVCTLTQQFIIKYVGH